MPSQHRAPAASQASSVASADLGRDLEGAPGTAFRFEHAAYFLTYSQVGDIGLEDAVSFFDGLDKVKRKYLTSLMFDG